MFSTALSSRATISGAYQAFREKHRSEDVQHLDDVPYATRLAIFEANKAKVEAHNARPRTSWVATINRFADFTEHELRAMRGYQRVGGRWGAEARAPGSSSSFLEVQPQRSIADSMDWRQHLRHSAGEGFIRNQGGCGSCWAVAAVGALEMHAEIAGGAPEQLAYDQLVDCVPNPRHCGGDGGCRGATAELAFQYVAEHGLARAGDYPTGTGKCAQPAAAFTRRDPAAGRAGVASALRLQRCGWDSHRASITATPAIGMATIAIVTARILKHVRLPENELDPLLVALSTKGPVVSSVDATEWSFYDSGVFSKCGVNATVNHAVLTVGYGTDPKFGKYFLIRNSWGPEWGEGGYIRLQRHDTDKGLAGHCGKDKDPKVGVGCDGGPPEIDVCGMCGVLSDNSYPTGVQVSGAAGV